MSTESIVAAVVVLLFLLAAVGLPIALLVGVYTGKIEAGFVSAVQSPDRRALPAGIELSEEETPVVMTEVNRARWVLLMTVGLLFSPLAWGLPLVVYAWRLRNRPQYVFTNQRLIVEQRGETESYDLDRVGQIQTGATVIESFANKSHVTFSIDNRTLITIGYLHDAKRFASAIEDVVSAA